MNVTLIKKEGKLTFLKKSDKLLYDEFVKVVEDGVQVSLYYEVTSKAGKNSQLSFIHGAIRRLANEIGESPANVKLQMKKDAGFCIDGECRSCADMSTSELESLKETIIIAGEFVGLQLR